MAIALRALCMVCDKSKDDCERVPDIGWVCRDCLYLYRSETLCERIERFVDRGRAAQKAVDEVIRSKS